MESLYERQENEIKALKSIFGNNFFDLREENVNNNHTTKKARSHSPYSDANENLPHAPIQPIIRIQLYPQNSQSQQNREIYVNIDLKCKITLNYPNELPKISLENEKGLSTDQVKKLHKELVKKANELIGFEMIYELCQQVQEYLYEHNKPPAKSFYDQMLEYKTILEKKQMEEDLDEKLNLNDQLDLRAEIDQAVDLKIKLLNEERKKEKEIEKRERLSSANKSPLRTRNSSKNNSECETKEISSLTNDIKATNQMTSPLKQYNSVANISNSSTNLLKNQIPFRPFEIEFFEPQLYKLNCVSIISYDPELSFSAYRAIDVNSQQIYTVYEWKFNLEKNKIFEKKKLDACYSEMHKIEEEFKRLSKLNNSILVKYVAYKYFKESSKNLFIIQLCLEYVEGNTVELFIYKNQSFVVLDSTLKTFAIQLLDALEYLHTNQIYHRDLKPSCVYIEKNGTNIKLSDYSLVKKINNLNEVVQNDATNLFQGNLRSDMHQLGLLILSLRLGEPVKDYHPQVPTSLPPELRSFVSICLNRDKIDCKYLKTHPFILKNTTNQENQRYNVLSKRALSIHYDDDQDDLTQFTDYPTQSRLNTEFEVIGVIGQGGFGEVLKVKNKLDSRFYAIKRIRINPNDKQNKQITREIKLLSRLNHENVVRYYSTWKESYEEYTHSSSTSFSINSNTKISTKDRRKSISHEPSNVNSSTKLIRFKSVTDERENLYISTSDDEEEDDDEDDYDDEEEDEEEEDEESNSSSSSDEGGKKMWSRRESINPTDNQLSSNSTDFSSSSNSNLSIDHEFSDNEDDKKEKIKSSNNSKKSKLEPVSIFKLDFESSNKLNKNYKYEDNSDESVIFAENSSDKLQMDKKPKSVLSKKSSIKKIDKQDDQKKKKKSISNILDSESFTSNTMLPQRVNKQYLYIQMEYCGGKTLKDLIDNGLYRNMDRVWSLFREILQGLNHIHEQGMIHRDLKPGNVLIDSSGQHAKIGDFGLATTKLLIHKDNLASSAAASSQLTSLNTSHTSSLLQVPSILTYAANSANNHLLSAQHYSNQNDSTSLSGAVGTALYVAPELLVPASKNKFNYNQKVDIYSLGIMFYEMCFPFITNMERIYVIQNLRQREIVMHKDLYEPSQSEKYKVQINLIKSMLNHDPIQRPSTKDLLVNETIPRKADEIAFDELLKYSFNNKQSTNYRKIFDAIFRQKISTVEDAAFDPANSKAPTSFRALQIREHVYNTFLKTFQRHGAYMINNSLLIPDNNIFNDFKKTFKLTDAHGFVVCLPYNQRIPFARYLARSGCTNIKRYYIGKVFSEKLTSNSFHPREYMEASFDIVTSTNSECLPEIELLTVVNEVIASFPEFQEEKFKIILNHSYLLNAIFTYCGIGENRHKEIYTILSDYNSKLIKSLDTSKETRIKWFKDHFPSDIDENRIEKLANFLLKFGETLEIDKFFSDLRNLTKTESTCSKLAKEGLNQLKAITNYYQVIGLKIPLMLSTSFVLPLISHPYEFSGVMFELLVQKKKKKEEYDIVASGGRYDKLITYFRTFQGTPQCACGVSFDFEKIISLINEKSTQVSFRNELGICSIGEIALTNNPTSNQLSVSLQTTNNLIKNQSKPNLIPSKPSLTSLNINNKQQQANNLQVVVNSASLIQNEIRNRLRLYKQLVSVNKIYNISTYILHEKFATMEEADEFCKKNCINSYAYISDSSIEYTSQIFLQNSSMSSSPYMNSSGNILNPRSGNTSFNSNNDITLTNYSESLLSSSSSSSINANTLLSTSPSTSSILNSILASSSGSSSNFSFIKLRSILDKGVKLLEKKLSLQDFLQTTNIIINNMSSFNSINFSALSSITSIGSSSSSLNSSASYQNVNVSYYDLINSTLLQVNSHHHSNLPYLANSPANNASLNSNLANSTSSLASSSSSLNFMPQLNITLLLDPTAKQQSSGNNQNRKKIESQIIPKISHVFGLFSMRTRIELIVIEIPENVLQVLANGLHLEMDEASFDANWKQCLEKLNNTKYKRQVCNFRLDEIIRDLRYVKKSKVFILYTLKTHQFKLLVSP